MGVKFARRLARPWCCFMRLRRGKSPCLAVVPRRGGGVQDADARKKHSASFDSSSTPCRLTRLILYLELLEMDGTLTLVGAPNNPLPFSFICCCRGGISPVLRRGMPKPRRWIEFFVAEHNITADSNSFRFKKSTRRGSGCSSQEVKYSHFVIDMGDR